MNIFDRSFDRVRRGSMKTSLLLAIFFLLILPCARLDAAEGGKISPAPPTRADRAMALEHQMSPSEWLAATTPRDPALGDLTDEEILVLGEAMYRDGLLPSGEVMEAFIRGDIEVDSTAFSCSSCHQRAGLGSVEGGVVTPPTNGRKLYQPYRRPPSLNDVADKMGRYVYAKTITERPAYTRESLKASLRYGIDPAGEVFNDVMPRYPLNDRDMAILVRYLELLSSEYSPGADPKGFKFATIVTDDVSAADREAMLEPIRKFVAGQNQQVAMYKDFIKFGYTPTGDMKYSFRTASLSVWDLKGEPETWRAQLDAYQQRDGVFAVLGGISNREWQPIHEFCEARRLPCFYPITDLPVVSDKDWYTVYFNKGYAQEGEVAARFLKRRAEADSATGILQLVQDSPAGRALAAGFDHSRQDLREPAVETLILDGGLLDDPKALAALVAGKHPGVVLLWADATILPHLPLLTESLAEPALLFVSSTALGKATTTLPEKFREQVFITYPYRLKPYVGDEEGTGFLSRIPIETTFHSFGDRRIATRTATMLNQSVLQGLRLLYDNLYRDHMLDVMSMQMDQTVPDYERLSFGPGQRYASKGCYVIQLGPGPEPELIPRSPWVLH
jgi:hypothetical protein